MPNHGELARENEALRGENEALRERLARLSEASLRINESLDYDRALQDVLDSACALTGARHGVLTLLDEAGWTQDFPPPPRAPAVDHPRCAPVQPAGSPTDADDREDSPGAAHSPLPLTGPPHPTRDATPRS